MFAEDSQSAEYIDFIIHYISLHALFRGLFKT